MPIYQSARYRVGPEAAAAVAGAAAVLVSYVSEYERGAMMYAAWQQMDDAWKFVHLFTFADEAAHGIQAPRPPYGFSGLCTDRS
ncbi:hypothetical protein [Kitasatospora sp. NPDC059571]|uniref:hypothetical protein n=1 Tax=Kitasatospora sp. NPDC059571 TaxID=3346871 RepID=UPI00369A3E53